MPHTSHMDTNTTTVTTQNINDEQADMLTIMMSGSVDLTTAGLGCRLMGVCWDRLSAGQKRTVRRNSSRVLAQLERRGLCHSRTTYMGHGRKALWFVHTDAARAAIAGN